MSSLSVVIPVYRSEANLPPLLEALHHTLPDLTTDFEVILVNDGSPDNSWAMIRDLAATYDWVTGINLMRNYGQHNALLCGIRRAQYETIITMDDDLQHPPSEIHHLLAKLNEGYDVVYGSPAEQTGHSLWRGVASRLTKIALRGAMGIGTAEYVSAFRAFRTHIRDAFTDFNSPTVTIDVLLTWGTNKFGYVFVDNPPRYSGESNYTFGKLVRHALTMITGYTTIPLRLASGLSMK